MGEIDYQALLKKYMAHVVECEGIDFTRFLSGPTSESDIEFTAEEVAELLHIASNRN